MDIYKIGLTTSKSVLPEFVSDYIPSEYMFCLYVWPIVSHVMEITIMLYIVPATQFIWYILNLFKVDVNQYLENDLIGKWVKSVNEMSIDDNASWLIMFENALIPQVLPFIVVSFVASYVLAFFSDEPLCKNYVFKSFNEW